MADVVETAGKMSDSAARALGIIGTIGTGLDVLNGGLGGVFGNRTAQAAEPQVTRQDLAYVRELGKSDDENAMLKAELNSLKSDTEIKVELAAVKAKVGALEEEIDDVRRQSREYTDTRVNNESALMAMALQTKVSGIINGVPETHIYAPVTPTAG